MKDVDLSGRAAVVTGGSRGIGKAIARALICEGMNVALCARDSHRACKGRVIRGNARLVTAERCTHRKND